MSAALGQCQWDSRMHPEGHYCRGWKEILPDISYLAYDLMPRTRDLGDAAARKGLPICSGVLDYFPDALLEVARVSKVGNDQHNPGQPLHWAKEKSSDEADALLRHLVDRGTLDKDGLRHSAKVAWRALALLQREIEGERNA